jgi:hypothetical protein
VPPASADEFGRWRLATGELRAGPSQQQQKIKRLTLLARACVRPLFSSQRKKAKVRGDGEKREGESLKPKSKILLCILCFGVVLTRASAGLAAAGAAPTLNVAPTCESEGRKQMALGRSSIEACKRSENEARHAVGKSWSHYQKDDKSICMGRISHGGHPSYVELQSCLESFKHAREIREAHAKGRSHSTAHAKDKL